MEKIALVTGSSRGIGRAIAAQLARSGWAVCINYIQRQDCAEELAAQLTAEGCRVMIHQADVADKAAVDTMVRHIEETFGPVSLLVNNAGIAGQCLFQDVTPELWHRFFGVNVDGAYHTIHAVLPHMLHEHEGCIINISSTRDSMSQIESESYAAAKGGIRALTHALAVSLQGKCRVNSISPGWIDTEYRT